VLVTWLVRMEDRSALRWIRVPLSDRVRVPNLVVVLPVVSDFAAAAALGETSRRVVRLSLGGVAFSSLTRSGSLGAPVARTLVEARRSQP
jgi:hypothetical protein